METEPTPPGKPIVPVEVLRSQCGLDLSRPVLAGISGGPDSLCLLLALHEAGCRVLVAHFDHRLRPGSAQEAALVGEHARRLGLPFLTEAEDVALWAAREGLSIEEAARERRYRFLFSAARREGAQAVAVGHTADDQVETVLMHFLRGAGLSGLKGMEARSILPSFDPSIPLVRPLLSLWRQDTEAFCQARGLVPSLDPSNQDETYFRNRLRHTLIPELEKYNPRFKQALVRTALALQGDHAVLQADLDLMWPEVVLESGPGWVAFQPLLLRACEPGLQRGLLRRAAGMLRPGSRDIGFEALERGRGFILRLSPRGQVDFINGLRLLAEEGRLYLAAYEADLPCGDWPRVEGEHELPPGGELRLEGGWVLRLQRLPLPEDTGWRDNPDPWCAWLDEDLAAGGLTVRPPRAGDSFQPLGMGGQHVKLGEFFIGRKVPRRARAGWPLVCVGGRVAWVPGYRLAHPFRVTGRSERLLHLTLHKEE